METACFFFFCFFSSQPDRGWPADCVSVRGVCGHETSEKNNNKQAHLEAKYENEHSNMLSGANRTACNHDAFQVYHHLTCAVS